MNQDQLSFVTHSRISVCMATFDGQKFIEQQISSILPQLGLEDELIISDDGSTDKTLSIINSFQDKRIKIFHNTGKKGATTNFENALRYSTGKYILLCDQDDIWGNKKVCDVLKILDDFSLVLHDCCVVNNENQILHQSFFRFRSSHSGFWRNLWKNSYMGCCMAFRSEILEYVLPFPSNICAHDWWIGLVAECYGEVYFLDVPLIQYRRHGANASPTGEKGFNLLTKIRNRSILLWHVSLRRNAIIQTTRQDTRKCFL